MLLNDVLKKDADDKIQADKKAKADAFIKDNTKSFGSGNYIIGQHIAGGRYIVIASSGSGNFVVYGPNDELVVNEVLGNSNLGVKKVIAMMSNGGKIKISGLNKVSFVPYQPPTIASSPTKTDLCAGTYIVGIDIPEGRYIASVNGSGSGNFGWSIRY